MLVQGGPNTVAEVARRGIVAGLAGVMAGVLVGGIGARIFMRIAGALSPVQGATTEAGFEIGEITVGGTIALIIFTGIISGLVGAVLYASFRPWLEWAGRLRGAVFGVVLFAVASATSDIMNGDNIDFFFVQHHRLVIAMIVAMFVLYGIAIEEFARVVETRIAEDTAKSPTSTLVAVLTIGAVLCVPMAFSAFFTNGFCDCDPSRAVAWSVAAVGVGTLLYWTAGVTRNPAATIAARVLGFGGLAASVVFGLDRAIDDARQIIP